MTIAAHTTDGGLSWAEPVQVDVLGAGENYVTPAPEVVDELARGGRERSTESLDHVNRAWSAVLRLLDARDPSFRN